MGSRLGKGIQLGDQSAHFQIPFRPPFRWDWGGWVGLGGRFTGQMRRSEPYRAPTACGCGLTTEPEDMGQEP